MGHRGQTLRLAALPLASLVALGCLVAVARAVVTGGSHRFDAAALIWIHSVFPGWLEGPMLALAVLGYYPVVIPLAVLCAYLFYRGGQRLSAVFLLLSAVGCVILATVLKASFHRLRPELFRFPGHPGPASYSFPSGHATVAVGFYGVLALLVASNLSGWRRWAVALVGAALVVVLGFSRLYLGVHYPTDVLGGYLTAAAWSGAVASVLALRNPKRASTGTERRRGRAR